MHKHYTSNTLEMKNRPVKHFRMGEPYNDLVACFQVKLSHTSYKQPPKPVNHDVSIAYNVFDETQNIVVNQQETRTWASFVFEASSFPFPNLRFLWNFTRENGARPATIDPLAHVWSLTDELTRPRYILARKVIHVTFLLNITTKQKWRAEVDIVNLPISWRSDGADSIILTISTYNPQTVAIQEIPDA